MKVVKSFVAMNPRKLSGTLQFDDGEKVNFEMKPGRSPVLEGHDCRHLENAFPVVESHARLFRDKYFTNS